MKLDIVFQSSETSKRGWEISRNQDIFSVLTKSSSNIPYVPSSSFKLNLHGTISDGIR